MVKYEYRGSLRKILRCCDKCDKDQVRCLGTYIDKVKYKWFNLRRRDLNTPAQWHCAEIFRAGF